MKFPGRWRHLSKYFSSISPTTDAIYPFSLTYLKLSSSCPQGDSNLRPSDNWQSLDHYSHSATRAEIKSCVFSWDIWFKVTDLTKLCKSLFENVVKLFVMQFQKEKHSTTFYFTSKERSPAAKSCFMVLERNRTSDQDFSFEGN